LTVLAHSFKFKVDSEPPRLVLPVPALCASLRLDSGCSYSWYVREPLSDQEIPRPPPSESGSPSPIPGQIGNRGNGNLNWGSSDLGLSGWPTELATGHWQPPLTCVADRKSAFRGSKAAFGPPPDRVWYSQRMSIPDFPIFGQIGNRGFPDSRFWPTFESDGLRARAGWSFLRSYRQLQVLRPVNHPAPRRDALAGTGGRSRPLITVTLPSRLEDARALTVEPMVISFIRT
jgi:hypothetical protein